MSKSRRSTRQERPQQEAKPVASFPLIIGIVAVVFLIIAAVLIFTGNNTAVPAAQDIPVDNTEFPVKGDLNAPVTLVDFSDYG